MWLWQKILFILLTFREYDLVVYKIGMVGKMGSDTMASGSREDLEAAKEHFVQTVDFPNISCKIGVRRLNFKKRKSPFLTEDLVFTLNFHPESQNAAEKILIMSSLVFVNEAVISLVDKLKNYFDDSKRRFCFFSAHIESMTSDLFSGARNIHEESSEISAASILEPSLLNRIS